MEEKEGSSMSLPAITVRLEGEAASDLVSAVVEAMRAAGLAVPVEGRTAPFSLAELERETGLKRSAVKDLVTTGVFARVPHTARVLVTVASVRAWQAGGARKGGLDR